MFKKKKNNQTGSEMSEVGKRHNLRISNPYGYYPEDVDKVLLDYEELLANHEKEIARLEKQLQQALTEKKIIDDEFRKMKMELQFAEIPDISADEGFSMMGKMRNINPEVGGMPEQLPEITESVNHFEIVADEPEEPQTFDNLISAPKKKEIKPKDLKLKQSVKEEKKEKKKKKEFSILNENGEFDILK